ncbi:hypothetical protein PC115_g22994 [Phytophthora cactorum]|uniref:Uncharacterized protein n=1 Tax=Phytophthora cactorum TaxID=29920 RepID=A0A8T1AHH2_9STRA|nr:hypothetical protein PC115_g22994 [Phytophthora cactorum]
MRDAQGCRRRRQRQHEFGLKRSAGEFPARRRPARSPRFWRRECQRALQHLEKDVINEERQATPLISEPTPGVPIRVFCRLIYSVTTIRAH